MKIQFIGGGKMGQALFGGLIRTGWAAASDIHVVELNAETARAIGESHPGISVSDAPLDGVPAVFAVKPHLVVEVASALVNPGRVLSVAAGISTAAMESSLPDGTAVMRSMPNTPALLGLGASALARGSAAGDDDELWAKEILESVGLVELVTEDQINAVTGLSGSGPAYVFLMAEALVAAGVAVGLSESVASNLATQTLLGASTMLREPNADPVALRTAVTTPNGTTAAGIATFEDNNFRELVAAVVKAAADRSAELGQA